MEKVHQQNIFEIQKCTEMYWDLVQLLYCKIENVLGNVLGCPWISPLFSGGHPVNGLIVLIFNRYKTNTIPNIHIIFKI